MTGDNGAYRCIFTLTKVTDSRGYAMTSIKKLTKTGLYAHIYCKRYGWNFRRVIWEDEDGNRYIKINNCPFTFEHVYERADYFMLDSE